MPLPSQSSPKFWLVLLHEIQGAGGQIVPKDAFPRLRRYFPEITDDDMALLTKDGQNKWENTIRWVRAQMVESGLIERNSHGLWRISPSGQQWLSANWKGESADYSGVKVPAATGHTMATTDVSSGLRESFLHILSNYGKATRGDEGRREVHQAFVSLRQRLENCTSVKTRPDLMVKVGFGMGSVAKVPWAAVLDRRETDSTTQGVYCVYLFKADLSGVYVTLNQGVGRMAAKTPTRADRQKVRENADHIRTQLGLADARGFTASSDIDLADGGPTAVAYQASTILHKFYGKDKFPTDQEVIADMEYLFGVYQSYVERKSAVDNVDKETPSGEEDATSDDGADGGESAQLADRYTVDDFVADTSFARDEIERWRALLLRKKQIIIQGPLGTGKTFVAERLARLMVSETPGCWDIVQFHPAYGYEDFIQGYFPKPVDGVLHFKPRPGRFLMFCDQARPRSGAPCVLVVDEINRANLARVFGELMYLLEYREKDVPLATTGDRFSIPENVYLIGTMNTADRSIALVDHALRRRFTFVRLQPRYDILEDRRKGDGLPMQQLIDTLKEINRDVNDPNFEIGISFFLKDRDLKTHLQTVWVSEIEPYLEEYFYDQPPKVKAYRWDALVKDKLSRWAE